MPHEATQEGAGHCSKGATTSRDNRDNGGAQAGHACASGHEADTAHTMKPVWQMVYLQALQILHTLSLHAGQLLVCAARLGRPFCNVPAWQQPGIVGSASLANVRCTLNKQINSKCDQKIPSPQRSDHTYCCPCHDYIAQAMWQWKQQEQGQA